MMLSYFFIRLFTFPLAYLPLSWIHFLGNCLGSLAYALLPKYRKRTLSNLSLAKTLKLKDLKKSAKRSFQHLLITCLEYPKFAKIKNISKIAHTENPEVATPFMKEGKGVIFFCGHQSNWELLFIEGTKRMAGVAIGRPLKNRYLYRWIVSIREKYGGRMITPKQTMKEGLRALRRGAFLGIVGDQALPESSYAFDFFGRLAWTSPAPAILSHRSGAPIIVATIRRKKSRYLIHYSDPIIPIPSAPLKEEIERMMKKALELLEEDIRKAPEQWLWQHNRWKQETAARVYYRYRHESILVILDAAFDPHFLPIFKEIYPRAFLTLLAPDQMELPPVEMEIIRYRTQEERMIKDYRFKLVFNLTQDEKLKAHFMKLSVLEFLNLEDIKRAAAQKDLHEEEFPLLLKAALLRGESAPQEEGENAP